MHSGHQQNGDTVFLASGKSSVKEHVSSTVGHILNHVNFQQQYFDEG